MKQRSHTEGEDVPSGRDLQTERARAREKTRPMLQVAFRWLKFAIFSPATNVWGYNISGRIYRIPINFLS